MSTPRLMLRAVLVPVGRLARVVYVAEDLDAMREQIGGGWIEQVTLSAARREGRRAVDGIVALCDEDGTHKGLPYNRGLRGPWLVVGVDAGRWVSLDSRTASDVIEQIDPSEDARGKRVALGLLGLQPLAAGNEVDA